MNNKKKQTAVVAMATVLSVTTIANPLTVMAQEDNPLSPTIIQEENGQLETAPAMIVPENVQATAGTALKDVALPEHWTWADDSTLTTAETAEYPARFTVDDVTYDYSEVEGYNAENHYVEKMVTVTVEPAKQEPVQPVQKQTRMLGGNMPTTYAGGDIEINETNFPDEAFRTWLKQQSYGTDGTITQAEIADIKTINVSSNKNIKDLTGIEYFTALTLLNCENAGITSLDVSRNKALYTLFCNGTKIESLDVSQNTTLATLVCNDTPLAYLNIGENKHLTTVNTSNLKAVELEITEDSFNIADKFAGIDKGKISSVSGADYDSSTGVMSNYQAGTPITYTYDCGTSFRGAKQTIDVTLNLKGYEGSSIEINETNFPDETFRNYIKSTFDKDKNGGLSKTEIEDITTINVSDNKNIKDLTGIEYFTALTTLYCDSTGITSLDVSQNVALTTLYCGSTGIESLDVSKNTALTYLFCAMTGITKLDVSKNTALTTLYCYNTGIESLDVSQNVALTTLYCNGTSIESLDVSKNTALEWLYCNDTGIESLDVSKNTALTKLVCNSTPLAYLNIGENNKLTTVDTSNLKDVELEITEDSFNIADKFAGIDKGKISSVSGADYDSTTGVMSNYQAGIPITYTYDCGTSSGGTKQEISVTLNLTDTRADSTISITADLSKTYNGTAVTATPAVNKTGSSGDVSYKWEHKKNATEWETIASAPADAGTYRVTATLASDSNYKGATSDAKEFTIAQADSSISVTADLSKTYDRTAVTATPAVSKTGSTGDVSYKWERKKNATEWEDMTSEPKDAGTYRVTATLASDSNYKGATSDAKEFTISQAENSWTENLAITGWTYGETASEPTANAMYGTVMFTYSDSETGTFTADKPTDAGTWYVKATVIATADYTGLNTVISFTIAQAEPDYTIPQDIETTYGQTLADVTLPAGFSWADATQSVGNVGTNTFTAVFTPDDTRNYKTVSDISIAVTVQKANNAQTGTLSMEDWTYGNTPATASVNFKFGSPRFLYSDRADGTYTNTLPTSAGTWYVKAVVDGTDNYEGMESEPVSFVIAPKDTISDSQINVPGITADTDLDKLVIKDGEKVLVQGTDYDVTKTQDGKNVTVTITFKGNYTGTITKTYIADDNKPSGKEDTENSAVQTGDTTTTGLWAMLMAIAAGAAALLKGKTRKEETEE